MLVSKLAARVGSLLANKLSAEVVQALIPLFPKRSSNGLGPPRRSSDGITSSSALAAGALATSSAAAIAALAATPTPIGDRRRRTAPRSLRLMVSLLFSAPYVRCSAIRLVSKKFLVQIRPLRVRLSELTETAVLLTVGKAGSPSARRGD